MKYLVNFVIIVCCSLSAVAQDEKTIYVIDGYTLQPLTGFSVIQDDVAADFRTDHNTIVTEQKATGSFTIQKEGYENTTFELRGNEDQHILVKPLPAKVIEMRSEFLETAETLPGDFQPEVVVDVKAEFPGGQPELLKFISRNLRYPEAEMEYDISGKIYMKFVVETDGSITNITFPQGLSRNMEIECLRVMKLMPKWTPAMKDGIIVRSYFNLPIRFYLN